MRQAFVVIFLFLWILILSACNLPLGGEPAQTPTTSLDQNVVMTLTAISQNQQQIPTQSPIPVLPTNTLEPSSTFTPTFTLEPSPTFTFTKTGAPTQTKAPTTTPKPEPGTIEGGISGYPYGSLPKLAIVAFQQEPPYNWSYWITAPGSSYFAMTSAYLLPGKWLVVAYDASDNRGGCPTLVTVKSEETVSCNITDWSGSYPAKPSGVPFP